MSYRRNGKKKDMKKLLKVVGIIFASLLLLIAGLMIYGASLPPSEPSISERQQEAINLSKKIFGESGDIVKVIKKDKTQYTRFAITHEHFKKANLLFDFANDFCIHIQVREKEEACFFLFYKYNDQVADVSEIGKPIATYNYVPASGYMESTLVDGGKTYSTKSRDYETDLRIYFKEKGLDFRQ